MIYVELEKEWILERENYQVAILKSRLLLLRYLLMSHFLVIKLDHYTD